MVKRSFLRRLIYSIAVGDYMTGIVDRNGHQWGEQSDADAVIEMKEKH